MTHLKIQHIAEKGKKSDFWNIKCGEKTRKKRKFEGFTLFIAVRANFIWDYEKNRPSKRAYLRPKHGRTPGEPQIGEGRGNNRRRRSQA